MAAKKDVEKAAPAYTTDELAAIGSFEEAMQLAAEKHGADSVARASESIGDGFKLLENKDMLCGVECLFLGWDFHMGDHGEFVSCKVVTRDNQKYIVNDGSSGLRDQLMAFTAKHGRQANLFCDKGLRRSDYKYTDEKGEEKPAVTYYLDTSA